MDDDPMQPLIGCSVSYRIAVGPLQGRKVLTLQTLPAVEAGVRYAQVANEAGFSLKAGVAGQAWERDKLERLCRCATRFFTSMHFIFEPLDFIEKLASLVPKPRVNLTRFHGFFVRMPHHPNSPYPLTVKPAKQGKGKQRGDLKEDKTPDERRTAMTWAQRL
jgi:hypothetical protein